MVKRIAFFLPSLGGGGAERVLIQIANELTTRGYIVDLVVGDDSGPYQTEVSANVKLISLATKRTIFCLAPLIRYLIARKPYAVFVTMMHANVLVAMACWMCRCEAKLIVRESNIADVFNGKSIEDGRGALIRLASYFYPKAHAIVAVSEGVKRSISNALLLNPANEPIVINNPVISSDFYNLASETTELGSLIKRNVPLVVAVGRLTSVKDFATLLKAFSYLRSDVNCQLIILGEGKEREYLEQMALELAIADSVFMPGFVKNPFPLISQATVCVSSSIAEGSPNVLIQALALERRVVATDCPHGPAEILDAGHWGELVPCREPVALYQAMKKALYDKQWQLPDEKWREKYTVHKVVDLYEALLT